MAALGHQVVAVMGPKADSARAFAAEHGATRSTVRLDEILEAEDVDAVIVASPNDVHVEQTLAAMRHGKHVLCEVPLAMSAVDAERVAQAARQSAVRLTVCQTQRFSEPVAHLRRLIEQEQLVAHHVVIRTTLWRRENVGWTGRRRSWVDNIVWHHGSHAVDTALWLLDDRVESVSAELGRRHPETGLPMDISIAIRTCSGALASLVLSYNSVTPLSDLLVIAEEDTFRLDGGVLTASAGPVVDCGDPANMQSAAIATQDKAFVRSIRTGEDAEPTPASLLPVYRVLQQVDDQLAR
jgi:2-hydroxy-4-carboxymuconate semialdehyde hemiacetal dehydrogenase